MQRMILGRTGLEVYRLGFGGIPIQRVSEAEAVETVRHAIERGVDFIDTSRAYTTSERRIGLALKEAGVDAGRPGSRRRQRRGAGRRVVLASKSHAKTADAMRADLETSLKELQTGLHRHLQVPLREPTTPTTRRSSPREARWRLCVKARDEGLIGHIGITSHSLDVLDRCLDDGLFDVIMVCFSFLEPQARETIIPKALEKNVGVLAMKPFSGGVIEDARLALKYALAEPGVLVLAGVEHPDLFDENWRVFQEGAPLTEAEQAQIAALQQSYDKVFCRRCDYCQPCTEDIPIQTVLGVRSMVKRMGKETLQKGPLWPAIERGQELHRVRRVHDPLPVRAAHPGPHPGEPALAGRRWRAEGEPMAYDAELDARVEEVLGAWGLSRKKMFGGTCYLLDGKMTAGVSGDSVFLHLSPEDGAAALQQPNVRPFEISKNPTVRLGDGRSRRTRRRQSGGLAGAGARFRRDAAGEVGPPGAILPASPSDASARA